jgi:hypothetical protein
MTFFIVAMGMHTSEALFVRQGDPSLGKLILRLVLVGFLFILYIIM